MKTKQRSGKTEYRPHSGRKFRFLAGLMILCLAAALFGCGKKDKAPELMSPIAEVEAYRPVTKRIVGKVETLEGRVVPKDYPCFSAIPLAISEVKVGVGDYVKAGDVLAESDTTQMKEDLKQVNAEIASLNRQKALAQEVTDLTLKKLGIERDTEIILSDSYELSKKDKEIATTLEDLRYQKAVIESDLSNLAKQKAKLEKEMSGRTFTAAHDGYVTYVKDFTHGNHVDAYDNILVVSDFDDLYIEVEGLDTHDYKYEDYKSKWTFVNGQRVLITEHPYTSAELSYAQGLTKYPPQSFDLCSGNLTIGYYLTLYFSENGFEEKLAIGNDSIYRENGDTFVYVKNEKGEKEKRKVELGLVDDVNYTEVISGLSEGEIVFYKNMVTPPVTYETVQPGLQDYTENGETDSTYLAYPYTQFIMAPVSGTYHGSAAASVISEGEDLCSVVSSAGVIASEEARIALSKFDRNRKRQKQAFEAGRVNIETMLKQTEGLDSPDLTIEIDAETGETVYQPIRELRHIKERLNLELEILHTTEESNIKDYNARRVLMQEKYNSLSKTASGDGVRVSAPANGRVSYKIYNDGDEVGKDTYLMAFEMKGNDTDSTRLYTSFSEGGTGQKVKYQPLVGQPVTAKSETGTFTGSVIAVNGDPKRYILFTRDGKEYVTSSSAFTRGVQYQFYVRIDSQLTEADMKGMKINFGGRRFEKVVALPVNSVKTEENRYTGKDKYYVWKVENDMVVKEYVKIYATDAVTGSVYIVSGVDAEDMILK
ncbi:MAG: efflux RND transporter periplasmic adaptor subunit [Lachnospiraceae bacterium]|nr:efflux RND transporter periplasmic adaptor subunit [Lachnospiraceae bacterium]